MKPISSVSFVLGPGREVGGELWLLNHLVIIPLCPSRKVVIVSCQRDRQAALTAGDISSSSAATTA